MSRAATARLSPQSLLVLTTLLVVLLALLPARLTGWLGHLNTPLELALAPIQEPTRRVVVWLLGDPDSADPLASREELSRARDEWHAAWLQLRDENDGLRRQVRELQRGTDLIPELGVRRVIAPVIGGVSDMTSGVIKVRRGTHDGVISRNTVAVVDGVQLVGRVVRVRSRFSLVLPLTDRDTQQIEGVVMLDETTRGPACLLEPVGDGTLRGSLGRRVDTADADAEVPIEAGMTVRLTDRTWPTNARMLIIGRVESVKPDENPLYRQITVRPLFNIDRVSEVILHISDVDAVESEARGTNAAGQDGGGS